MSEATASGKSTDEQKERLRIYVSEAVGDTRKVGDVRSPTVRAQVEAGFRQVEGQVAELKQKYGDNPKKTVRVWYTTPDGRAYSERVTVSELERRVKQEKQAALARGLESVQVVTTVEEARPTTPAGVIEAARESGRLGPMQTETITGKQQHELIDILVSQRKLQQAVGPGEIKEVKESLPGRVYLAASEAQQRAAQFVETNINATDTLPGRFVKSAMSGVAQAPFMAVKIIPGAIAGLDISIREPGIILPALIVSGKSAVFSFKVRPVETTGTLVGTYFAFRGIEWAYSRFSRPEAGRNQLEGVPGEFKRGRYERGTLEQELTAPYKLDEIVQGVTLEVGKRGAKATPTVEYIYVRDVPPSELYQTIAFRSKPYTVISSFTKEGAWQVYPPPSVLITPPTPEALLLYKQIENIYGPGLAGHMVADIEREGGHLGYVFKTIKTEGGRLVDVTTEMEAELSITGGGKITSLSDVGTTLKQITHVTVLPSGKRITVSRTVGLTFAQERDLFEGIDVGGFLGKETKEVPGAFPPYPVGKTRIIPSTIAYPVPKEAKLLNVKAASATGVRQQLALRQDVKLKKMLKVKQAQGFKQAQAFKQASLLKQDVILKQQLALRQDIVLKMDVGLGLDVTYKTGRTVLVPSAPMRTGVIGMGGRQRRRVKLPKFKYAKPARTFRAFPDPLSAFESEVKYGKFTAPPQTKALRRRYRKAVLFSPLTATFPTLEQLKAYKSRKKKKKKTKKGTRKRRVKDKYFRRFRFL